VTVVSVAYVLVNLEDEAIHGREKARVAPRAVRASDAICLCGYGSVQTLVVDSISSRHLVSIFSEN
jgi:hypothetical protein